MMGDVVWLLSTTQEALDTFIHTHTWYTLFLINGNNCMLYLKKTFQAYELGAIVL